SQQPKIDKQTHQALSPLVAIHADYSPPCERSRPGFIDSEKRRHRLTAAIAAVFSSPAGYNRDREGPYTLAAAKAMSPRGQARAPLDDVYGTPGKTELLGGRVVQFMATARIPNRVAGRIFRALDDYADQIG